MTKKCKSTKGNNNDELDRPCLDKLFNCEQSDYVEKPGDTQSTLSNRLVKYRET